MLDISAHTHSPAWGIQPAPHQKVKGSLNLYRTSLPVIVLLAYLLAGCKGTEPTRLPGVVTHVNLQVNASGVYALSAADLRVVGLPAVEFSPETLRLSHRGIPQPFLVHGSGDTARLIFLAQVSDSRFTQTNHFVLEFLPAGSSDTVGSNLPINEVSSSVSQGVLPPATAAHTVLSLEENKIYNPQAEIEDRWLWQTILGKNQFDHLFDLPGFVDGPGTIQVNLWSNSQADVSPDHHVMMRINNVQIGDTSWDGRGPQVLTAEIPAGVLRTENNAFSLIVPGDTGAPAELNHLDSISITYLRTLDMQGGQITFLGTGGIFHPSGFEDRIVSASISGASQLAHVQWLSAGEDLPTQAGSSYWLADLAALLKPAVSLPRRAQDLRDPALGADYLAIGPQDLLDALTPLLDLRRSQGFQVLSIPLDAIYDQFGYGFPEPESILAFLQFTQNWQVKPAKLLLVGDASYDPSGFVSGPEINRLPTFFVHTTYGGETASDLGYALLDQDSLPDLAIGRLPASTSEQVSLYVQKVLAYEASQPPGPRQILAVSDGTEAGFESDARAFLDQLGANEQATLVAALPGDSSAAAELRAALQSGLSMVAYFGHGSVTLWGKDKIFSAEEASTLTNQRYPVIMTMTCLNGLFTHPKTTSLAESLLWSQNGGAVAVLAPSSLTLAVDQAILRQPFVEAVFQNGVSLGEALLTAQRATRGRAAALDEVVATFLLFGDPAIILK